MMINMLFILLNHQVSNYYLLKNLEKEMTYNDKFETPKNSL